MQSLRSKNIHVMLSRHSHVYSFDLGFRALTKFKSCGLLVAGHITKDKCYAKQQFEERFRMLPVFPSYSLGDLSGSLAFRHFGTPSFGCNLYKPLPGDMPGELLTTKRFGVERFGGL